MAGHSLVLASTSGFLLAADVPFPVELSALVMVGMVLRWLIRRDSRKDLDMEGRLATLERKADWQRHLKHVFLNRLMYAHGTLRLVRQQALLCNCGAMTPVLALLDLDVIDRMIVVPEDEDEA